jgi:phosphohistidine phosphatase SixA
MCPRPCREWARSPPPAASLSAVRRALPFLLGLALLAGCGEDEPAAADVELAEALKAGGVALVMRHAITEPQTDREETLGDCTTQRNLTDEGREQAREIGRDIDALGVPVGDVLASPLCRTTETAELAFGEAKASMALLSAGEEATPADDRRIRRLGQMATAPEGTANVFVTHTGNIGGAFDQDVQEGDVVVVRDGEVLGVVGADDWDRLIEAVG